MALVVLSAACGAPGSVEGVVRSEAFSILDQEPAFRADGDDGRLVLTIKEETADRLSVVTLIVPEMAGVQVGDELEVAIRGQGDGYLTVSDGDLVVTERGDGARILSTENTEHADAVSGTLVFSSIGDPFAGDFEVDLNDGGNLRGTFMAEAEHE